jgi:NAD(P)-dependent dehydrogenase (short-subunit alcohol dehydrogenase family)
MNPSAGHPLPDWLDLRGRVGVVTGGGTHLGLAMGRALAELGMHVVLAGRRGEVVEAAAQGLRAEGLDAHAAAIDAADEAAVDAMVQGLQAQRGRLDLMLCNAGGGQGREMAPDIRRDDLEATLRKNVSTTLVCAQAAARSMIAGGRGGAIVTIGSIHASLGSDPRLYDPDFRRSSQSYHAAKGAILNLTRALACEWAAHDITVNCISPGQIPKPAIDAVTRDRFRQQVPLGRLGVPEDLRGAITLFASPAGRWITGQNLVVDGGWSAW